MCLLISFVSSVSNLVNLSAYTNPLIGHISYKLLCKFVINSSMNHLHLSFLITGYFVWYNLENLVPSKVLSKKLIVGVLTPTCVHPRLVASFLVHLVSSSVVGWEPSGRWPILWTFGPNVQGSVLFSFLSLIGLIYS